VLTIWRPDDGTQCAHRHASLADHWHAWVVTDCVWLITLGTEGELNCNVVTADAGIDPMTDFSGNQY
jgi:hypothetical protein